MQFRFPEKRSIAEIQKKLDQDVTQSIDVSSLSFPKESFYQNGQGDKRVSTGSGSFDRGQNLFESFKKVEMKPPQKKPLAPLSNGVRRGYPFGDLSLERPTVNSDPVTIERNSESLVNVSQISSCTGQESFVSNGSQLRSMHGRNSSLSSLKNFENESFFKNKEPSPNNLVRYNYNAKIIEGSLLSRPQAIFVSNESRENISFQIKKPMNAGQGSVNFGTQFNQGKIHVTDPSILWQKEENQSLSSLKKEAETIHGLQCPNFEKDPMNESMKSTEIKNLIECDLETFAQFFARKAVKSVVSSTVITQRSNQQPDPKLSSPEASIVQVEATPRTNCNQPGKIVEKNTSPRPMQMVPNAKEETPLAKQSDVFAVNAVSHDMIHLTSPSNISCDLSTYAGEFSGQGKPFMKKSKAEVPRIPSFFNPAEERFPILEETEEPSTRRCQERESAINRNFQVQVMDTFLPEKDSSRIYTSIKTVGFDSRKEENLESDAKKRKENDFIKEELISERSSVSQKSQPQKDSIVKEGLLTVGDLAQWKNKTGEWFAGPESSKNEQKVDEVSGDLVGKIRSIVKECLQVFIKDYEKDKAEYMIPSKQICESINQKVTEILYRQGNHDNSNESFYSEVNSTVFPSTNHAASDSYSGCFFPKNMKTVKPKGQENPGSIRRSRSNARMNNTGQALFAQKLGQDVSWSESSSNSCSYHDAVDKLNERGPTTARDNGTHRSNMSQKENAYGPGARVPPLPKGQGSIRRSRNGSFRESSCGKNGQNNSFLTDRVATEAEKDAEEERFKRKIQSHRGNKERVAKEDEMFGSVSSFGPNFNGFSNLAYIRDSRIHGSNPGYFCNDVLF